MGDNKKWLQWRSHVVQIISQVAGRKGDTDNCSKTLLTVLTLPLLASKGYDQIHREQRLQGHHKSVQLKRVAILTGAAYLSRDGNNMVGG